MPDDAEARPKVVQDILNMLYATFLQDYALRSVLVSKGQLTDNEIDARYQALSETPELRGFRERMGIVDSELIGVLGRLLRSFEGTIQ
jgi:hypothetical protein